MNPELAVVRPEELTDAQREARIAELTQRIVELGMCKRSRALFEEVRVLVAGRSAETVKRMEARMNLL